MSARVPGRGRAALAALARGALVLLALVGGARRGAAQFLEFRPPPPARANGSVPVAIVFGGYVGADGGCSSQQDPQTCTDPYYYPYDDAVPPSALSLTVNGADQTGALSVSGPVDDNCWYGDYNAYQCTRTYTAAGNAPLAPGQVNTLVAAASAYGLSQTANVSTTTGPVVTLISPHLLRDPALCAQDCGELVQTYTTPSYVSRDVARDLTLVYRSGRARPRPVVELDVVQAPGTPTPDRIGLQLLDANNAAVSLNNGQTEMVRRFAAGVTNRLAAQVAIGGVVSLTAVVTAYDATGASQGQTTVPVVVLVDGQNGAASPYGVGWGVAGLQRWGAQAEGAVITDGDGSIGLWRTGTTTGPVTQYTSPPGDFTQVTWDANAGLLTRRYPDGTVVRFDGSGAMLSSTDRLGNATTFSYADQSKVRLRAVTDPTGQSITLSYRDLDVSRDGWAPNTLACILIPNGRCTSFGTDPNTADLITVQAPDLVHAFEASYNGAHQMQHWTPRDRQGGTWDYTYSFSGELQTVTAPDAGAGRPSTRLDWWAQTVLGFRAGENGTMAAPGFGIPTVEIRSRVVDAQGLATYYALDGWGAPAIVTAPGNVSASAARDTLGRLTRTTSASGGVTTYAWNPAVPFLLDSVADAAAKVTTRYTYYGAGDFYAPQFTYVNGTEVEYRTYSSGRLASVRSGGATQPATRYGYARPWDARPDTVFDPRGHATTYAYEGAGLGNASGATDAAGTRTVVHDAFGRDSVAVDPLGHRTVALYDVLNRPTRLTDANGRTTTTAYDPLGAATVTDAAGQVYRDSVNALGLPFFSYDPGGAATSTAYDAAGRVAGVTNRRGQTVSFGYDPALGTLTSRAAADQANAASVNAQYGADALGRVRWASNAEGADTVWADSLGRDTLAVHWVPAITGYRYAVRSAYDSLGRRVVAWYQRQQNGQPSGIAGNDNQTTYTYGAAGELRQLGSATFQYNNELAPTGITYEGSFTVARGYTDQHTLASQHFSSSAENTLAAVFSYDSLNRVTARYTPSMIQRRSYAYDPAGQLAATWVGTIRNVSQRCTPTYGPGAVAGDSAAAWNCPGVYDSTNTVGYAWDAVGNPAPSTGASVTPHTGNRLAATAQAQLGYDADGNLTSRVSTATGATTVYTWNSLGQLVQAQGPAATVTFGYDAWGRRVRKSATANGATTTTYFVWDGADLAADVDASGNTVAMYSYLPGGVDRPFAVQVPASSAQRYYYVTEPPGHVTGLVDYSGRMVQAYRYDDPFGAGGAAGPVAGGWTNRFLFGAREYDAETGLYYQRARYYDPTLQRFLSPDPTGLAAGVNWYAYAANDPVNHSDPTGLSSCLHWEIVGTDWICTQAQLDPITVNGGGDDVPDIGAMSYGGGTGRDGGPLFQPPTGVGKPGRPPTTPNTPPPQQPNPACPLNLPSLWDAAGKDAYARSVKAQRERATVVVNGSLVHPRMIKSSFWSVKADIPQRTTLFAHGHLRVDRNDHDYAPLSPADEGNADTLNIPWLAYSRDSASLRRPGGPTITCGR